MATVVKTKASNLAATKFTQANYQAIIAAIQAEKSNILADIPMLERIFVADAWPTLVSLMTSALPTVMNTAFGIMETNLGADAPVYLPVIAGIATAVEQAATAAESAPTPTSTQATPPVATPIVAPVSPVPVTPVGPVTPAAASAVPVAGPVAVPGGS